ncbi:MAG: CheR family methyltransferase [Succinivibrio sp.]
MALNYTSDNNRFASSQSLGTSSNSQGENRSSLSSTFSGTKSSPVSALSGANKEAPASTSTSTDALLAKIRSQASAGVTSATVTTASASRSVSGLNTVSPPSAAASSGVSASSGSTLSSASSTVSSTRLQGILNQQAVTPASRSAAPLSQSSVRPATVAGVTATLPRPGTVDNESIAKKIAEAKAALSSVNKVSPIRTDDKGRNSIIKESQEVTDVQYRRFAAFIEEKCGIVLGAGKQYLVNSRLSTLLAKFNVQTVDELINRAMEDKPNNKVQEDVIDAMTTNETLWFRDTYPYTALENTILPELAKRAKYPVRIWSAACSSGQEPYSIAMVVQEQLGKMLHVDVKQTQIIGTDLSPEMLAQCRQGLYDVHALSRGLSAERKNKFFKPAPHKPNMMQIEPRVKDMVEFRPLNLLGSYALMGRFDVIFCRNVLIYFSNEVKADILRKLTMCLNPGGYLILGSTETLVGVAEKYEMMRCNPGIIYRLKPQKYGF